MLEPISLTVVNASSPADYILATTEIVEDYIPQKEREEYVFYSKLAYLQRLELQLGAKKKKIILSAGEIRLLPK